jgi:glycosyltransferase involved in cell wall biosynthesis
MSIDTAALVLAVPFHNEERYLPRLIASLREQDGPAVPVVFVDNASTDGSMALVRRCAEFQAGRWVCLEERRVGKFHAMRTATAFAAERHGARCIGFVDADAFCTTRDWLSRGIDVVRQAGDRLGYTYSPFSYDGFEHLPTFAAAYRAYETVLWHLVHEVGWLANGQGFFCPVEVLQRYFEQADVRAEIDLRLSLLALLDGRCGYLHPMPIRSSGRRIIVNAKNFAAWCFYGEDFYVRKDINAADKLDLNAPEPIQDLRAEMVGRFFDRRALKLAVRHLIPLLLVGRGSPRLGRVQAALGSALSDRAVRLLAEMSLTAEQVLGAGLDEFARAIEKHPASIELSELVAARMRAHYESEVQPLVSAG